MKIKKMSPSDFVVSDWSGGKTTQIAIDPPTAFYSDHSFNFRISSATVELEKSDFTMLPDYMRVISPIKGNLTLFYNSNPDPVKLNELELSYFDGAWQTRSQGKVTDYNLMTRKGVCKGNVTALILNKGNSKTLTLPSTNLLKRLLYVIWCVDGSCSASVKNEKIVLCHREAAQFDSKEAFSVIINQEGDKTSKIMVSTILFPQ